MKKVESSQSIENTKKSEISKRPACPTCSSKVEGRSDKVFCCLPCKNKHHKQARKQIKSRMNNTTKVHKRNFVILEGILGKKSNKMRIHKDSLFHYGFDLSVCSRAFRRGSKFIYELAEYQFWLLNNGIVEVRRMEELETFMPSFFERWEVEFPLEVCTEMEVEITNDVKNVECSDFQRFDE